MESTWRHSFVKMDAATFLSHAGNGGEVGVQDMKKRLPA